MKIKPVMVNTPNNLFKIILYILSICYMITLKLTITQVQVSSL